MNNGLPKGWATATLGGLFDFKYGKGLLRENRNGKGSFKVYGSNGVVGVHDKSVTKGPTIIVGRKGSVGEVHFSPEPCWPIDTAYFIDEFPPESPPAYWALYIKSLRLGQQEKSSAIPGISRDDVYDNEVPVPPLAEQRRIVAKLTELLDKVDASQQRLAKIPVLLKRFRQSVLAAACSGRLTADWREENPAAVIGEELLSKVLKQRADVWKRSGRKGALPEAPIADTSSLPDVPHGWAWIPLEVLGANPFETVQTGPFGALLHKEEFTASGVPVVAVGNLTGMGFSKEGLYFVSEAKAQQLSRFDIQAGDVLFARSGATLGKVCVAPAGAKDWRMTGHILRARLNRNFLLPDFCVFALRGDPAVTRQVFGSVQGTTRPGYNTTLLESIALPLAPLPEQQEIVRRVEGLFALADQLEERLAKARGQVDRLTPSLLARAFAGRLVPQDPTDEPARRLLEKIKAARKE